MIDGQAPSPEATTDSSPGLFGPFKQLAVAVGGLSACLGGLSATLYALGYLATRSHLRSVGIDPALYEENNQHYLYRGVNFVLVTGSFLTEIANHLMAKAASLPVLLAAIGVSMLLVVVRRFAAGRAFCASVVRTMLGLQRHVKLRRYLTLALVIVAFQGYILPAWDEFTNILRLGDGHAVQLAHDPTLAELQHYWDLMVAEFVTGFTLLAVNKTTSRWRYGYLAQAPLALIFLVYLVFLPMAYGALLIPTEFPHAELVAKDVSGGLAADSEYLLLNRSSDEFMLWDMARRAVVWIPASELRRATFTRRAPRGSGQGTGNE